MQNLVIMKDRQAITTSLQVSETFERNHRHILAAIDELKYGVAENWADLFWEDSYTHDQNKQKYRMVYMNRDGFTLLAMGFTGRKALSFKLKYIDAFNQMEKEVRQSNLPTDPMEILALTFAAQKNTDKKVDQVVDRVTDLEENVTIDPGDYGYLTRRINKAVFQELEIKRLSKHKQQVDLFYKDINKGIHEITGVKTRSKLKQKQFDAVDSFITNWKPSTATITLAEQIELAGEE
ncbi:Rha family transcriptional regulator [Carnobacterium maltaromaticum]|uniref:Rha family transcriptional regulator n=1 Tax=Carnobacterium maltaromaticum TaxID=2751 RepID=UPI003B9818EC